MFPASNPPAFRNTRQPYPQRRGGIQIPLNRSLAQRVDDEIPSRALLYRISVALPVNEPTRLPSFTFRAFNTTGQALTV